MDKQNAKASENKETTELTPDQMDKVSGGTLLIDGEPLPKFSWEDVIKPGIYLPEIEDS